MTRTEEKETMEPAMQNDIAYKKQWGMALYMDMHPSLFKAKLTQFAHHNMHQQLLEKAQRETHLESIKNITGAAVCAVSAACFFAAKSTPFQPLRGVFVIGALGGLTLSMLNPIPCCKYEQEMDDQHRLATKWLGIHDDCMRLCSDVAYADPSAQDYDTRVNYYSTKLNGIKAAHARAMSLETPAMAPNQTAWNEANRLLLQERWPAMMHDRFKRDFHVNYEFVLRVPDEFTPHTKRETMQD